MFCLQILGRVYAVLSDKEQKAVYDEQGTVDEDSAGLQQDRDWDAYWRLLFKKVKSFMALINSHHSVRKNNSRS